jgi:hypothetical protein
MHKYALEQVFEKKNYRHASGLVFLERLFIFLREKF